jgi:hypothetical protein
MYPINNCFIITHYCGTLHKFQWLTNSWKSCIITIMTIHNFRVLFPGSIMVYSDRKALSYELLIYYNPATLSFNDYQLLCRWFGWRLSCADCWRRKDLPYSGYYYWCSYSNFQSFKTTWFVLQRITYKVARMFLKYNWRKNEVHEKPTHKKFLPIFPMTMFKSIPKTEFGNSYQPTIYASF